MFRIAIDAMGGDHAPAHIVRGVCEASLSSTTNELVLVGDAVELGKLLRNIRHDASKVRVHHAPEVIQDHENPSEAIAAKPNSSLSIAAELVAANKADAMISAGHTGALSVACAQKWKLQPGVRRAAMGSVFPTELRRGAKNDPFSLLLDIGAAIDATAEDLVTFAIMGASYGRVVSKNRRPRVALLCSGNDAGSGPQSVARAHEMLIQRTDLNFIGNIEGIDIPRGVADVIVCSGYVGNVVIKMLEGVSDTMLRMARYAYKEKLLWRAALAMLAGGVERLKSVTDWHQYGGAPLLGYEHLLINVHGRATPRTIQNAIKVTNNALKHDLHPLLVREIASFRNKLKVDE